MLSKKLEMPISLKVSYTNELVLKVFVPQKFEINKFARHWIMMAGFSEYQEHQIIKKYFSYVNEGDLIKIKGEYIKSDWKQKNMRTQDSGNQKEVLNILSFEFLSNYKNDQNKYFRQFSKIQILQNLTTFYEENIIKQMDELKAITIFLNINSDDQFIIKILDLIRDRKNQDILVNIFVNEIVTIYQNQYQFIDKWVTFYSFLSIQQDLKFLFYRLSKITVKKIFLNLKCFDGEMIRRNLKNQKRQDSDWNLQYNNLSYRMNFPQCNKIYINKIQLRNLGYQEFYKFELSMECVDVNENSFSSNKSFKLKPQREEFQSIINYYHLEDEKKIKGAFKIQQSLKCDCLEIFEKLQNLKQVCERIQIQIKNNTNFVSNLQEEEDKMKMLHSFEI